MTCRVPRQSRRESAAVREREGHAAHARSIVGERRRDAAPERVGERISGDAVLGIEPTRLDRMGDVADLAADKTPTTRSRLPKSVRNRIHSLNSNINFEVSPIWHTSLNPHIIANPDIEKVARDYKYTTQN